MGLTEPVIEGEVVSEETTFSPDIPFSKSRSGWCISGQHAPGENTKGCPGIFPAQEYVDPAAPKPRKGGKPKTYTRPAYRCPCECHSRDLD